MVWAAILKSTGVTIATANTASDADRAAVGMGYDRRDFTLVNFPQGPPRA
jgi:hypothetical protein